MIPHLMCYGHGWLLVKFWTRRKAPYLSRKNESNVQQRRLGEVLCGVPSEWVPRGMTMRAFCDRNNVPYRVMDNFVRNIRKKIVEVEVTGRPEEGEPEAPAATHPQAAISKCGRPQ